MSLESEDETLKELQRQNDELLKRNKAREIQQLQTENDRLRRQLESDAISCSQPQESMNPGLSTYRGCDFKPPETLSDTLR